MRFGSFCTVAILSFATFVCVMAARTQADQSLNYVHCPHFTAAQWKLHSGRTGNTYGLLLTNDKTSCSDATAWAKKMMRGSFPGFLPIAVKGPAGYDCHVTPDTNGGAAGGTCHKTDSAGNITAAWDWIAENG